MRLGQIRWDGGAVTAAIFNHASARPIPDYTLCELISRAEKLGAPLAEVAEELSIPKPVAAEPLIPLQPREVWAADRIDGPGERRPRVFLKGTARVCVGPGQPIGIHPDSRFTAPAAEIGVVLGARGRVLGYTLANDVSAWDLEGDTSKTFSASCALGPVMVTADEIGDPGELSIFCTITRDGATIFSGETGGDRFAGHLADTIQHLMRANPVPAGSVLLAGAGLEAGERTALEAGDSVTIRAERIGELTNRAARV